MSLLVLLSSKQNLYGRALAAIVTPNDRCLQVRQGPDRGDVTAGSLQEMLERVQTGRPTVTLAARRTGQGRRPGRGGRKAAGQIGQIGRTGQVRQLGRGGRKAAGQIGRTGQVRQLGRGGRKATGQIGQTGRTGQVRRPARGRHKASGQRGKRQVGQGTWRPETS